MKKRSVKRKLFGSTKPTRRPAFQAVPAPSSKQAPPASSQVKARRSSQPDFSGWGAVLPETAQFFSLLDEARKRVGKTLPTGFWTRPYAWRVAWLDENLPLVSVVKEKEKG